MLESAFHQYRKATSKKASIRLRNQLVLQHQALARDIAHRMKDECPEPYEDLEQLASLGLIRAIEKFDPDRGVAFSSFAVPYIRGEIQHFLRDDFGGGPKVPRREIELSSRAMRVSKICGVDLDQTIVARGLNVSAQKLRRSMESRSRKPVKSLDEIIHEPTTGGIVEQDYSWIRLHIANLSEPSQSAIIDRYLRNMTEAQIARKRGVKVAEVEEWLKLGLLKLKAAIPEEYARDFSPGV